MELIDRVAFMRDLAERIESNKDLFRDDAQYLRVVTIMNGFFLDLKEFPTVEVDSRPKGEWIIERGCGEVIVTCSNCGAKDYVPTTIDGRFYFNRNYCWDCGADMGGKE